MHGIWITLFCSLATLTVFLLVLSLTALVQSNPPPGHGKHGTPYQPVKTFDYQSIQAFGGKFVCKNDFTYSKPTTIWTFQVCDGHKDCADSSDEASCPFSCPEGCYKCTNEQKCLPSNLLCDNKADCENADDEKHCRFRCTSEQYRCDDEDKCIHASQVCDRKVDCLNSDDELHCDYTQYTCRGGEVVVPFESVCDGNSDCPEADDEANCGTSDSEERRVFCPNGWIAYSGSCYYIDCVARTFALSAAYCASLGAKLVEINNEGEYEFARTQLSKIDAPENRLWIGITDNGTGVWRYLSNGETVDFLDWQSGEPDSAPENCGHLRTDGGGLIQMGDTRCSEDEYYGLCEL